ncbi:MAG: UvrY/SirA/GacA family response regulator transcription factor [Gammaproteobacteria bacterium]|nr:UvrY/SirA/GacA family response regulator transcription factor [Gammaproteobacteria bacterium]
MINVLLVEDHELVRLGIKRLLSDVATINVIGEASCGEDAISFVRSHEVTPDIVLMDVNMPGIGGLEATRRLLQLQPQIKIIIVTVYAEEPFPSRLLQVGAKGYLTKGCCVEEMTNAIKTVHSGERYIAPEVAQRLALTLLPGGSSAPFESLSDRELQVMLMLTKGQRTQDISKKLCLSPKTVSTYRHRLYQKLDVQGDVELTHLALRYGIIES